LGRLIRAAQGLPITSRATSGRCHCFITRSLPVESRTRYWDYVSELRSPLYPFGYGRVTPPSSTGDFQALSSRVEAGGMWCKPECQGIPGSVAGDEVVQLYIRMNTAGVRVRSKTLKGFVRYHSSRGETRRVTFHLPVNQLDSMTRK